MSLDEPTKEGRPLPPEMELFLAMRDADTATQTAGIGHNGAPQPEPFGIKARWLKFADEAQLLRLAILNKRIERKQRSLSLLIAERTTIMNTCCRRAQRADAKAREAAENSSPTPNSSETTP